MSRTGRWRWWQVLLLLVGLTAAAGGLFLALVFVSLIGGVDELFRGDPPRESDPEVVAAQRAASGRLDARGEELSELVAAALKGPVHPLGGGEIGPQCRQGQHNWKIDDDYDLVCELHRITVVAVEDTAVFHADTAALDAALTRHRWVDEGFGLERVLEEYWEPQHGSGRVEVPVPGTDGYSMEDLPSGRYRLEGEGRTHTLEVSWVEPGSTPDRITYYAEDADLRTTEGEPTTAAGLVSAVPQDGYALVVTERIEYFRE